MEIAFPTEDEQGMLSQVHDHFGSARFFTIVQMDNDSVETVVNQDRDHAHGQCQPLAALGREVNAVAVGGIGRGALNKLQAAGIKTYRAVEGTVQENLSLIRSGLLPEFAADHTCPGHGKDGVCAH